MAMRILDAPISLADLRTMATEQFGDFVKAVVDLGSGRIAVGGEMHADEEALLLDQGARQSDLWGINLYPERPAGELVEFDSMINVRPSQGNRSRGVDDLEIQRRILDVVAAVIVA